MKRLCACALAAAAALSLAACAGGGDARSGRAPTAGEIRELAALSAPAETAPAQQARQHGIFARADSLILSTMHVEITAPEGTHRLRWLAACAGPRCDLHDPATGETDTIHLATAEIVAGEAEAVGSAHGITLVSETVRHMGVEAASLGAWMAHGAFGLFTDRATGEAFESSASYALALGQLTDRPLTGSATWLGIMVGTPTAGEARGERLVGTAALNYDLAAGTLDAAFGAIRNIDRAAAHTAEAVLFSSLAVDPHGTFARGQSGARIQGAFHGPGHAEAAGVFEQSDISGAFGARRQ